jgi:predicted TIM-barrel fold metal-dependent hydrolase
MLTAAIDVLGPDRVMFGDDDPYRGMKGRFGGEGGAREFVDTAPISAEGQQKLGHLNAERLLAL